MITKKQIKQALKDYPGLGYSGFRVSRRDLTKKQHKERLEQERQDLLNSSEEVNHVTNYLQDVDKIKSFNAKHSSYGLKHWAEKTAPGQYVSNGSFIVGAILAGFKMQLYPGSRNVIFNMSEWSLKKKSSSL